MDKKLRQLKNTYKTDIQTGFTDQDKQAVLQKIKQSKQRIPNKRKSYTPVIFTVTTLVAVLFISLFIFKSTFNQDTALNKEQNEDMKTMERSIDADTNMDIASFSRNMPILENVTPTEEDVIVEWEYNNMDQGNNNYNTAENSQLVVQNDTSHIERGDVIYFKTPASNNTGVESKSISRVVGLPGETIEIKEGYVYINGDPLDTFYAQASIDPMADENIDQHIEPFEIDTDSVFVLGDNWLDSIDSRDYGTVSSDSIIGIVRGYQE